MLIQFAVENYRSIESEVLLNLVPAKSRIHPDHVLVSDKVGRAVKALPVAIMYGANASGKSNLISALEAVHKIVLSELESQHLLPVTPFRLDRRAAQRPCRFEFILKHRGVLYTYGFAATPTEIREEWLFAVFNRREVRVFERTSQDGVAVVEPGNSLASTKKERDRIEFITEGLAPHQLFLSEAARRNVELLQPLFGWFKNHLKIIAPNSTYTQLLQRTQGDERFANFLSRFLKAADTGIDEVHVSEKSVDKEEFILTLPEYLADVVRHKVPRDPELHLGLRVGNSIFGIRELGDEKLEITTIEIEHRTSEGEVVRFEPTEESDGTNRLMHLAPALLNLEDSDSVYVIDELDRSLHPALCRAFLQAFLDGIAKRGCQGQLILTTHETSLLDLRLLRRDEIWFVEKDERGSSQITSLAEFDVRADLRVDTGYVTGRFGAIPFVGDIRRLFAEEDCK